MLLTAISLEIAMEINTFLGSVERMQEKKYDTNASNCLMRVQEKR